MTCFITRIPRWMRRLCFEMGPSAALGIAFGLSLSGVTSAQTTPATASAASSPAESEVVCLVLENRSQELSDETFRLAVERLFAVPAQVGCASDPARTRVSIVFAPDERELTVTFTAPTRGSITRVLQAPESVAEIPEAAAMVALELSRRDVLPESQSPEQTPSATGGDAPTTTAASLSAPAQEPMPQTNPPELDAPRNEPRPRQFANAGFFYPLAVNFGKPDIHTVLDFNLLYGVVGEVEGLQLGTFNEVRGPVRGLQTALLVNVIQDSLRGVSVAGLVGYAAEVNSGLQAAGVLTLSNGATDGAQVAFGGNLSRGSLRGAQVSAVFNASGGSSQGLQASFGPNVAKHLLGVQASALLNVAETVTGAQIGLVNIGKRVRGTQIGLVNISEEVDGFPIGLVSVSESGGIHVAAWASTTTYATLGLRLATRHTYSMFTVGYHDQAGNDVMGPGLIVGTRVPVAPKFAVDFDVGAEYLLGSRLCCFATPTDESLAHMHDQNNYRLRVIPTWQPYRHFSVFAGAGAVLKVPFALYSNVTGAERDVTLGPEVLFGVSL